MSDPTIDLSFLDFNGFHVERNPIKRRPKVTKTPKPEKKKALPALEALPKPVVSSMNSEDGIEPIEFVPIPAHPDYCVGSNGSIWSRKSGEWRRLSPFRNKDGYLNIKIQPNVKNIGFFKFCSTMLVHRLVLLAFHGEPDGNLVACHDNGIKTDNRPSNLRWGTDWDNAQDYSRHQNQEKPSLYPSDIKFCLYDISWGVWV